MSITVNNLTKYYGKFRALTEVNLDIQNGQTVGLVGLNGAGKTTLMKSIVGLIVNFNGEILINNHSVNTREAKSHVSFLSENFSPPLYLTGYDFVSYMVRLYGKKSNNKEINDFADRLNLYQNILSQPIRTYSKGMRQKLGLMATMLPDTDIVILDEPLSGLDPEARSIVKNAFGILRKNSKTLFFSSHILTDLEGVADRLVVIHEGKKTFDGTPEELRSYSEGSLEDAFIQVIHSNKKPLN